MLYHFWLLFLKKIHITYDLYVVVKEEFLKDVMQFLILRGHNRLIPQGGLAEFPEAILNAKRLDLFNLYREVKYPMLPILLPREI